MLLSHLSRLAEDLIFFQSDEAGFVALPDALATGSSRMPQKKNPDLLELCRGQAGRAIGELSGMLAVMKGLPLAYDKDLQLDKEPVFRTRATLAAILPALTALIEALVVDATRLGAAAGDERLLATALADALAARGVPFRQAHELVGARFAAAEARGTTMAALGPGDGITSGDLRALDLGAVLGRRAALGGTAPARVLAAARAARKRSAARARR
jgi:argininosuccinate lyase